MVVEIGTLNQQQWLLNAGKKRETFIEHGGGDGRYNGRGDGY